MGRQTSIWLYPATLIVRLFHQRILIAFKPGDPLNVFLTFFIPDSINVAPYILFIIPVTDQQYAVVFNHNHIIEPLYYRHPARRQVYDAIVCIV